LDTLLSAAVPFLALAMLSSFLIVYPLVLSVGMRELSKDWFVQPKRGCNAAASCFLTRVKSHVFDYIIISIFCLGVPMLASMTVKENGDFYVEMSCQKDFQCAGGSKSTLFFFVQSAKFCVLFSHGTTRLETKFLLIKQGSRVLNPKWKQSKLWLVMKFCLQSYVPRALL
jgi:hypothetical protein